MAVPMMPIDPSKTGMELVEQWIAVGNAGGFNDRLNTRPTHAEPGLIVFECAVGPGHANLAGILHGGVTAALADIAAGAAVMTLLAPGEGLLTADLHLRYLKPGSLTATLVARARVAHREGNRCVTEITLTSGDAVVAHASAMIAIRPARG